jgi:hypothetical protein
MFARLDQLFFPGAAANNEAEKIQRLLLRVLMLEGICDPRMMDGVSGRCISTFRVMTEPRGSVAGVIMAELPSIRKRAECLWRINRQFASDPRTLTEDQFLISTIESTSADVLGELLDQRIKTSSFSGNQCDALVISEMAYARSRLEPEYLALLEVALSHRAYLCEKPWWERLRDLWGKVHELLFRQSDDDRSC